MNGNKKAGKKSNPNRPEARTARTARGTARKTYWAEHKGRRTEGRPYTECVREVAGRVRHVMGKPPVKLDWEA